MKRRNRGDEEDHFTVGASVLDAVARGVLITVAGLCLGAILGTSPHALAVGLGALGLAAVAGIGVHIGAAMIHNIGCARRERETDDQARQAAEVLDLARSLPAAVDVTDPAERRNSYVELVQRQRQEPARKEICLERE
jgi:hypothetical protein